MKRKTKSELFPNKLVIDDTDYVDKNQIVDQFNKYFTNIGPELASNITDTDEDVTKYILSSPTSSFYLSPVSKMEVSQRLQVLTLKNHPQIYLKLNQIG